MSVEAFIDTNILLYASSKDPADKSKAKHAQKLLLETNFGVSLQVVQEFYHNARIKARLKISEPEAEGIVTLLLQRPWVATGAELFRKARTLCNRYQLRYWDAAILVAAAELGAQTCYSEDLSHGQLYGGVKVINPFQDLK